MASVREWLEGARIRTLSASTAPVFAGTATAWFAGPITDPPFVPGQRSTALLLLVLCLIVGLGFQIGSNFANDYSDGMRGTDDHRIGPQRLVGSGAVAPRLVKRAAFVSFAVACLAGLLVVGMAISAASNSWEEVLANPSELQTIVFLVLIGLACLLAAWFYTGGRKPYGYAGLGEVFVFIFFGLVATAGSSFVQSGLVCVAIDDFVCEIHRDFPWAASLIIGAVMGALATAILVANNLRDLASDAQAGKYTLPVRLGDTRTRWFYVILIAASILGFVAVAWLTSWFTLLSLLGLVLIIRPAIRVIQGATGRELISVLKWTGLAELACAILLGVGLWIGWLYG